MAAKLSEQKLAYADLLIRGGVNLQPGQALLISAELAHRDFVRLLVRAAYKAGARYVDLRWQDPLTTRTRYETIDPQYLDFVPAFEVPRRTEMLETGWALIALTGSEYPDAFENVDPKLMLRERLAWADKLRFWQERVMNNEVCWCVAGVPTKPWAKQVFPKLKGDQALRRLWELVLRVCRADRADPLAAWAEHDSHLKKVASFLDQHQIRMIRYLDEVPGPDGKASTDLTIGLTDRPAWSCGSAINTQGLPFLSNIPTEEVFTSPHRERVNGWARTSKPGFPFEREVTSAYLRFRNGQVVEWQAERGQEVLDELFQIAGARHLGEVSLVDVRSPINQAGLIFHDTLFDENAACHIAFGRAYPEGVENGNQLSRSELDSLGLNSSDTHQDLMIGTDTMSVIGTSATGQEILIMRNGRFADEVTA